MTKFLAPEDSITIAGHRIDGGLIYVGQNLAGDDGQPNDPCLVNPHLAVARGMSDRAGRLMPYFPSYSEIGPTSRLAYLEWLESGRRNGHFAVSLAFLFFYGLERALLVDRLVQHRPAIRAEILRLMTLYGDNNSFQKYARQLLDFDDIEHAAEPVDPQTMRSAAGLEIAIGWRLNRGLEITLPDLFRLALARERSGLKILELCWEEFLEAHRDTLAKITLDSTLIAAWRGATSCFVKGASKSHQALRLANLPVGRLTVPDSKEAPLMALQKIVRDGIQRFRTYLDIIEANPDARGSEEALMTLMTGSGIDPKLIDKKIRPWSQDLVPAPLKELRYDLKKLFPKERIDIRAMADAERMLAPHGLYFVPSAVMGDLKRADEETQVRVIEAAPVNDFEMPKSWTAVRTLVSLARAMLSPEEAAQHRELILRQLTSMIPSLPTFAATMLDLKLQSAEAPAPDVWRELKKIPADLRRSAALFGSALALAVGRGEHEETRAALQRAYKALGQEEEQLWSDLHELGFGSDGRRTSGSAIDLDRAREIARDTARAAEILAKIYSDEELAPQPITAPKTESNAGQGRGLPGLAPRYQEIALRIAGQPSLSREAFDELAKSFGLMPDGAIDAINEWAYEAFDRPAIEENGTNIQIDMDCFLAKAA